MRYPPLLCASFVAASAVLLLDACGGTDSGGSDPAGGSSSGDAGTDGAGTDGAAGSSGEADTDTGTGADTGPGGEPETRDGSRLVIQWIEPTSGPAQMLGVMDTQLGVTCSFRRATDGVLRCLPTLGANGAHYDAQTGTWTPYVDGNTDCPPSYVVTDDDTSALSCDELGWIVYARGESRTQVCGGESGGTCTITRTPGDDAPPGSGYYLVGDVVDPGAFVAGEVVIGDGDTRIRRRFVDGEDGARVGWDVFDTQAQRPCSFRRASDGQIRCLPDVPRDGFAFIDTLDDWIPYRGGNAQCPPELVDWPETASPFSCEETSYDVHEIGEAVDEICMQTTNGECSGWRGLADDAPAGAEYFLAADAVDLESFVAAQVDEGDSDERIGSAAWVTDDGLRLEFELRDADLGIGCAFAVAGDGAYRCLPNTNASGLHYAESTMQWTPYRQGNPGCPPTYVTGGVEHSVFSCDPQRTEVFEVAETLDQVCTATLGSQCSAWATPSDDAPTGAAYYLAGVEVDPAQFAEGAAR